VEELGYSRIEVGEDVISSDAGLVTEKGGRDE
jgi:hypothetical protein